MKPDVCMGCGVSAPDGDTSYTAIGHGWRVFAREVRGRTVLEWHCAMCWRKKRASEGGSGASTPRANTITR